MSRFRSLVATALCVVSILTAPADAGTAYTLGISSSQGSLGPTDYSLGFEFTPNVSIFVTDLGFFDQGDNGLAGNHDVGIYLVSTMSLVVSNTVLTTDPISGSGKNAYAYHTLPVPVELVPGVAYRIAAVGGVPDDDPSVFTANIQNANFLTVDPAITMAENTGSNATGAGRFINSSTLAYPTSGDDAQLYSSPNFLFIVNPIPEPTSLGLVALGGLVFLARQRRK